MVQRVAARNRRYLIEVELVLARLRLSYLLILLLVQVDWQQHLLVQIQPFNVLKRTALVNVLFLQVLILFYHCLEHDFLLLATAFDVPIQGRIIYLLGLHYFQVVYIGLFQLVFQFLILKLQLLHLHSVVNNCGLVLLNCTINLVVGKVVRRQRLGVKNRSNLFPEFRKFIAFNRFANRNSAFQLDLLDLVKVRQVLVDQGQLVAFAENAVENVYPHLIESFLNLLNLLYILLYHVVPMKVIQTASQINSHSIQLRVSLRQRCDLATCLT